MILSIFFFQNIKIKLNSRTWMALKSSAVIFQALEPLQPQWPPQPPWPQWTLQPHFITKILLLMIGYSLATKWPILVLFCGTDCQKSKFSLISLPFMLEAVEVSQYYYYENWLMELKCPNLRISEPSSNKLQLTYFYL